MRVIGLDPGTYSTGFALIERTHNRGTRIIEAGTFTAKSKNIIARHHTIHADAQRWLGQCAAQGITCVGVEQPFVGKWPAAAIALGQARGILFAALFACGFTAEHIISIEPKTVKKHATGSGHAGKGAVSRFVAALTNTPIHASVPSDATDAVAVALVAATIRLTQGGLS